MYSTLSQSFSMNTDTHVSYSFELTTFMVTVQKLRHTKSVAYSVELVVLNKT